MLEDTLRVLPYALGIAASPRLIQQIRDRRRPGEPRRNRFALAAGRSSALLILGLVGLLIDFDGSRSKYLAAIVIMGAAFVTFVAARRQRSIERNGCAPQDRPPNSEASDIWWFSRGIDGIVRVPKNLALALAAGISADNTGGVAPAELRNLGGLVAFASIGLIVTARLTSSRQPSAPEPDPPRQESRVAIARMLIIAGLGVAADAILTAV